MNELKKQIMHRLSHPFVWIGAGLIPCLLTLIFVIATEKKYTRLEEQALFLKKKKEWSTLRQKKEDALLTQLKGANRDYLEREVESISFLSSEVQKLKALVHTEPNDTQNLKRLEFLQNGENALRFKEQNFQRLDHFQEVEAIAENSVEMNQKDLIQLLAKIENVKLGEYKPGENPPDLLIRKFELSKRPLTSNEEHFLINLELIKRECVE